MKWFLVYTLDIESKEWLVEFYKQTKCQYIPSFLNLYNQRMRKVRLLLPFYRWGCSEKISKPLCLTVAWLVKGRAKILLITQAVCLAIKHL